MKKKLNVKYIHTLLENVISFNNKQVKFNSGSKLFYENQDHEDNEEASSDDDETKTEPTVQKKSPTKPDSPVKQLQFHETEMEQIARETHMDEETSEEESSVPKSNKTPPKVGIKANEQVQKKYKALSMGDISIGGDHVCGHLFRMGKFVNTQIEQTFLNNLSQKLMVQNDDPAYGEILCGLRYLIKINITAKRSYVNKQMVAIMRSKY
jgi:hypothetical protein